MEYARALVKQVTGKDYGWFFDVYLRKTALPELVETLQRRHADPHLEGARRPAFPMPVEVQVDGKIQRLAMTGGTGTITLAPGAHVVLDPAARILKRSKALEAYKIWKATPPKSKY